MERIIGQLLGRPFMAPEDNAGGGGNDGVGDTGQGQGQSQGNGDAGQGGQNGGGAQARPSAADIAARTGSALAKPAAKAGDEGGAADDGVDPATRPKGNGAADGRPEHIPAKFWDGKAKTVKADDLAKAYTTLESNFAALKANKGDLAPGEKPEDYLPEGLKPDADHPLERIREFDAKNDPAVNALRTIAHKHGLPVSKIGPFALDFLQEISPHVQIPMAPADVIKGLGDGGQALADNLSVWTEGLYDRGEVSEQELEYMHANFAKDPIGVRLLAKIREWTGEKPIPLGHPTEGAEWSEEEWHAGHRDPRYKSDPAFRAKVDEMGEKLHGDAPVKSSPAGVGLPPPKPFERRAVATTHR